MSDVLRGDDQEHRKDNHDSLQIKLRRAEIRQGKNRSRCHLGKIHDTRGKGRRVAHNDRYEDRDNREELSEQDGTKYSGSQGKNKHDCLSGVQHLVQKPCIAGC